MSGMNPNREGFEKALSASLREVARSGPSGAPPEVGITLGRAFRRHHFRRRIIQGSVLAVALLVCGAGIWLLVSSTSSFQPKEVKADKEPKPAESVVAQSAAAIPAAEQQTQIARKPRAHPRPQPRANLAKAEWFVALPAFALRMPDETLRVVRVEMPASSLRLLGATVRGEIADRRINADLLVGPDGTPYAVRLGP
jgi:hypothetical protein